MTVRSGMADLIETLRGMTNAGTNDYTVGTTTYWSNQVLQDHLDRFRVDFIEEDLYPVQQSRNGTTYYLDYRSQYVNLEGTASGTTIFKLDNSGGTNIPGTMFIVDFYRGVISFVNDTAGSSMLLTGRSFDLNAAAADVWRAKAAYASQMYDFSTDNHRFNRDQYYQHCLQMASYFEAQAGPTIVSMYRGDNAPEGIDD